MHVFVSCRDVGYALLRVCASEEMLNLFDFAVGPEFAEVVVVGVPLGGFAVHGDFEHGLSFVVAAVVDEGFLDCSEHTQFGRTQGKGVVVQDLLGAEFEGVSLVEESLTHGHCGAGGVVAGQEAFQFQACEIHPLFLLLECHLEQVSVGGQVLAGGVDNQCIRENHIDIRVSVEIANGGGHFVGVPSVVLVGKKNDVPVAERGRFAEVSYHAETFVVSVHADRRFGRVAQSRYDRHGAVRAPVVAHHDFVNGHGLRQDGLDLFLDIVFAVVCTEGYREHGVLMIEPRKRLQKHLPEFESSCVAQMGHFILEFIIVCF